MKKIYIMKFLGGAGGDFLAQEISKDPEFHQYKEVVPDKNNMWSIGNPLEKFNVNLKDHRGMNINNGYTITDTQKNQIDQYFLEKNLVVTTHWNGDLSKINLPRSAPVLISIRNDMIKFSYAMLWFKRFLLKVEDKNYKEISDYIKNNPVPRELTDCANKILERGYCYNFEIPALLDLNLTLSYNFSNLFFPKYLEFSKIIHGTEHAVLDVGELYKYPKNNVKEWQQVFKMSKPLDVKTIENYYNNNRMFFTKIVGKSPEDISLPDLLDFIKEYAKYKCPDAF